MSLANVFSKGLTHLQHLWLGRPGQVIYFGQGIGDDLFCGAVAHEFRKRGVERIVMFSRHAALFEHNPDVYRVDNRDDAMLGRRRRWGYPTSIPNFSYYDAKNDRDIFRDEHIITTMCRLAGMTGSIDLRTYLTLLPEEKSAGQRVPNQIAIQSAGLGIMKNKDWLPERYQAVVDELAGSFQFVQLGLAADPPLRGVLDLRGKTSLRESAAILASSRLFVGQVGFLMHLARAVECRSVIVFGGREVPRVSGYIANENITGPTPCSPCWQRNRCDFHHDCMRMIEPAAVVAAIQRQLALEGTPLPVEQVEVSVLPPGYSIAPMFADEILK